MIKKKPKTKLELKHLLFTKMLLPKQIDTCKIRDMSELYQGVGRKHLTKERLEGIEEWNVKKVLDFSRMFAQCYEFNANISKWETDSAVYMHGMFINAHAFNQDISEWNVKRVKTFHCMFKHCTAFNQDLSKWKSNNLYMYAGFDEGTTSWTKPKPNFIDRVNKQIPILNIISNFPTTDGPLATTLSIKLLRSLGVHFTIMNATDILSRNTVLKYANKDVQDDKFVELGDEPRDFTLKSYVGRRLGDEYYNAIDGVIMINATDEEVNDIVELSNSKLKSRGSDKDKKYLKGPTILIVGSHDIKIQSDLDSDKLVKDSVFVYNILERKMKSKIYKETTKALKKLYFSDR